MEENLPFEIIAHAGDAMDNIMSAMDCISGSNFCEARKLLTVAEESIVKAHKIQTQLIQNDIRDGSNTKVSIILVHAQDHLMNAILARNYTVKLLKICEQLNGRIDECRQK